MRLVASLLLIPLLLAGCAEHLKRSFDPFQEEVQALFDQRYIDPLTRYLEKYAKDPARADHLAQVRTERDRRCGEVAERYAARAATGANLDRLERGYRYSCPQLVKEFAARVAEGAEAQEAVDTEATETEPVVEPEAPEAKPEPVEQRHPQVDAKAAQNCYLLFSIKSYREAQAACEQPAGQGDARAQYNLGIVSEKLSDDSAALKWTRLAVARDLPEARLQLGLLYQRGTGVRQDDNIALQWFRRAAEQGVPEAQYRTGLGYFRGKGTDRDYGKARQWFERAAEQGYAAAQARLGRMYALGKGIEVDGQLAESWLKRAAEQGVSDAQYRLGVLYAEGTLVAKDETEAYVWLSLAALAGNREAEARRDRLEQALAPARIEEAQQRIRRIIEQHRRFDSQEPKETRVRSAHKP